MKALKKFCERSPLELRNSPNISTDQKPDFPSCVMGEASPTLLSLPSSSAFFRHFRNRHKAIIYINLVTAAVIILYRLFPLLPTRYRSLPLQMPTSHKPFKASFMFFRQILMTFIKASSSLTREARMPFQKAVDRRCSSAPSSRCSALWMDSQQIPKSFPTDSQLQMLTSLLGDLITAMSQKVKLTTSQKFSYKMRS